MLFRGWARSVGAAASVAVASLTWLAPAQVAHAQDELLCDKDAPEGWVVIDDASSVGDKTVVCNYSASVGGGPASQTATIPPSQTLFPPDDQDLVVNAAVAGVAVTIEYFCTEAAAAERWNGITGSPRDTEVLRLDSMVVTEEGPAAGTAAGQEREAITSAFFPGIGFTLQQKAFALFNSQTLATIVVNTNSREVTVEAIAEDAARTVSANHTPAPTSGCNIPPVGRTGGGSDGGSGLPPVAVVIGIGTVGITVGGITRRYRRKKRPDPGSVPPHCKEVADLWANETEIVTALEEAIKEWTEKLERAEKIHRNNVIKAKMVVNLEIFSTFAGNATDLAVALRGAAGLGRVAPSVLGEMDQWKKGTVIPKHLADMIENARIAARDAWIKFSRLRVEVENLLSPIEEMVRNLPSVKNAQQLWEFHMNRLGEMITDLKKADLLRKQVATLDTAIQAAGSEIQQVTASIPALKARHAELVEAANRVANAKPPNVSGAMIDVTKAKIAVKNATGDALAAAQKRLADAERALADAQAAAADIANAAVAPRKAASDAFDALQAAEQRAAALAQQQSTMLADKQKKFNRLVTQYNDLDVATMNRQGQIVAKARTELDDAMAAGRADLGKDLARARTARDAAEIEAASAQGVYDDLVAKAGTPGVTNAAQTQGVIRRTVNAVGRGIWWATPNVAKVPLTMAGEIILGVGQSPTEIVHFLVTGRDNIVKVRNQLAALRREIFHRRRTVAKAKRQLDTCRKAPRPAGAPLPPPTPDRPITTRKAA